MKLHSNGGGIGFFGLLTVIFICAKLFEWGPIAAWSWFWVFSPLLVGASIAFILLVFVAIMALLTD